jgi:hypothetical protein
MTPRHCTPKPPPLKAAGARGEDDDIEEFAYYEIALSVSPKHFAQACHQKQNGR